MKYTKSGIKTLKNSKEYDSKSATLLIKGGFINQTMSGVYSYLPLGMRVLTKIENIVREEMDNIGQEVLLPALAPKEFWKTTGRYDEIDVLMKTSAANSNSAAANTKEYVLNPTHEDVVTPLLANYARSYKDFPVYLYQIQSKFRNEVRPKSGMMRTREFRMKDLYSFHTSEEDLLRYYNNEATDAYDKVFEKLGLGGITVQALASGGDFTKEYSKEWQTRCETGEDLIFGNKTMGVYYNREVAPSKAPAVKQDSEQKEMEVIETAGITGMDQLEEFLGVDASHSMKTMIYETDDGRVIAAGVRGEYDINEIKLAKAVGCSRVELASEETIKRVTGADIGYAGIVDMSEEVELFVDESMEHAINFECGANKTDHHNLNVNWDRDVDRPKKFHDIKLAKEGDLDPETGKEYEVFRASEVGNIFPLNTKFTEAFGYTYTDEDGKEKPIYMGSYGIGTSRILGVFADIFNDDRGLIWPMAVTPYHVHMITLGEDEEVMEVAKKLYEQLWDKDMEVLWDDRSDVSAGVKFADADLIGCPIRLVVSGRSLKNGGVEFKLRNGEDSEIVSSEEIMSKVTEVVG